MFKLNNDRYPLGLDGSPPGDPLALLHAHNTSLLTESAMPQHHQHPLPAPGLADPLGSTDPFELNQSIWSTAKSSVSSAASEPSQAPPTLPPPASAPAPLTVNNGVFAFSQQPPAPAPKTMNSMLGMRRASAIEPLQVRPQSQPQAQSQQLYGFPQGGGNRFQPPQTNYTTWSGGVVSEQEMNEFHNWQQQQQQHQHQQQHHQQQRQQRHSAPETGFFSMDRRHSSVDSGYTEAQSPSFNENTFETTNPNNITETTPSLLQCYAAVDFYFTQDPYKRVSINAESMSDFSKMFEDVVKSGAQLPRFNSSQLPSTHLILVAFKSGRVDVFYLPEHSKLKLKINDLVVVEADRGRDLGKVLKLDVSIDDARLLKYLQHQEQQSALASFEAAGGNSPPSTAPPSHGSNNTNNVPTLHFPKPILRFAMPNEVYLIMNKQADEEKAKKICALKVDSSSLKMRVIDAEYQWDRRKLTFYYNASHRIDFRELVRELFRIYKTRIWMCAVTNEISPEPEFPMARAPPTYVTTGNSADLQSTSPQAPQANIWCSPPQPPQGSGQQFPTERDLSLLVPRQFSSPDRAVWN